MLTFWIVLVLSYAWHGTGITVGYHRLLSHRAFKCPKWVEYFIVAGGYFALEGSPVAWVATHRVHHRYSDMDGDPHSPKDGFWHSFVTWLTHPKVKFAGEDIEQTVPDLWRDPVYRFLDFNHTRNHAWVCLASCVLLRVVLFIYLGPLAVLASIIGMLMAFLGPFWVNSVCHIQEFGYRNFVTEDGSRNVWWVGLIGLGEGWHNNHHAVPQSARHGMKPSEIDFSWYYISLLSKLGLASEIRLPKGSKSTPVLDAALAAQLNVPCVTETAVANGLLAEQIAAAGAELEQQIASARVIADQLIHACDNLSQQVGETKAELIAGVSSKKEQINDQLISACDKLSVDVANAKVELAGQLQANADKIANKLIPNRSEADPA